MNQLEEQLKASRERERESLQPPVGGWAGVEAALAAEAAANTGGKPAITTVKWLTGLSIFLFGGFCWWLFATAAVPVEELLPPAKVVPVSSEETFAQRSPAQDSVPAATVSVEETLISERVNSELSVSSARAEITEPAVTTSKASAGTLSFPVILPTTSNESSLTETGPDASHEVIADTKTEVPGSQPVPGGNKRSSELIPEPTVEKVPTLFNNPASLDGLGTIASRRKIIVPQSVALNEEPPLSVDSLGLGRFSVGPTIVVGQDYTLIPPPRKPKALKEWQVHATLNTLLGPPSWEPWQDGNDLFERTAVTNPERQFITNEGEVIGANFVAHRSRGYNISNRMLRLGISRQMSSGFRFQAAVGYYNERQWSKPGLFSDLTPGQISTSYDSKEVVVPIELGVHFVFRKRHRLQSFLGVNAITYAYYRGWERYNFYDVQTNQTGLIRGFNSREVFNYGPEISVTAGVQYRFNAQWTVGVNVWANWASNYFLQTPVGIEIRRSLR